MVNKSAVRLLVIGSLGRMGQAIDKLAIWQRRHSDNKRDRLQFSLDQASGLGTVATGELPPLSELHAGSASLVIKRRDMSLLVAFEIILGCTGVGFAALIYMGVRKIRKGRAM